MRRLTTTRLTTNRLSMRPLIGQGASAVGLLALAYLLSPVLWSPLDLRFYNYFHAKRPVPPWTQVVVVGIDDATRRISFDAPVYPLSRHVDQHARITSILTAGGARAIAFDLRFDEDSFGEPPTVLADAFKLSGKVALVMWQEEEDLQRHRRSIAHVTRMKGPHPLLLEGSTGAFLATLRVDPDGTLRRVIPERRLAALGLETLPEHLAGRTITRALPIEFPSLARPIPVVSYQKLLDKDPSAMRAIDGKIVIVGSVDDGQDAVGVPRLQPAGGGRVGFELPGAVVLAAITETLIRRGPLRDVPWYGMLVWNLALCLALVGIMPPHRPILSAAIVVLVIALATAVAGALHAFGGVVLQGGLLLGCLFTVGVGNLVRNYVSTEKRLHAEQQERVRVSKELKAARETQERFLPQTIPDVPGLDLWGTNISSLEVSGDYFDIYDAVGASSVVLAIADVSGKGLPAALLMSNVQAGLHTLFMRWPGLDACMTALNRLVADNTNPGQFVTMAIAEIGRDCRQLTYVSAGHNPPFLIRGDGSVRRLEERGLILGVFANSEYTAATEELLPGDVFCLYTDGVTEAMDQSGKEFGEERLTELLLALREGRAVDIGHAVLRAVEKFSGSPIPGDDETVVIAKVLGHADRGAQE